ncbi:MAG TPA: type II toxin-antitoxin system VapC family toxin [Solirubrobacterales bacterium]|nr:type II toxin-antitoxin system VapC family toxin [Solirubrobacterales bacterium]
MMLLDAGVWVAALVPDEPLHRDARALLDSPRADLAALDLTVYEVVNAIGAKLGQQREAQQLGRLIIARCARSMETVDVDLLDGMVDVVGQYGLTSYDAAYVSAARRNGWTLVSTDFRDLVDKGLAIAPDAAL